MGKVKVSDLLYEAANLLCIVAERLSRGYVPPPPMENKEWEKVKARLARSDELPYKKPERLSWRPMVDEPMDPTCVLIEIETCDDFPVNWPTPHPETRWRWACHDHAEAQYGPPLMGPDTYRGMVAHLVTSHPDRRWPEGMKPE
jgi:hypothetical protein